jgi:glycosyltransferase involved in cell wall biosynthesis
MKVLMLGWEYPPHISGGLGTACEGLTKALSKRGIEITFVVPSLFGGEQGAHMRLVDSAGRGINQSTHITGAPSHKGRSIRGKINAIRIPSFLNPYLRPSVDSRSMPVPHPKQTVTSIFDLAVDPSQLSDLANQLHVDGVRYGNDIFAEVSRYTAKVVTALLDAEYDVIHAHDWMTYPAGVALANLSKKPLIVHVHSLEFDRSGENVNQRINDIERFGLEAADSVVAVSYYTKSVIEHRHAISSDKIRVVHNGVYPKGLAQRYRQHRELSRKIVLFLGRVTYQKGPDYFVEAAAQVIPHIPDVLFVLAGAGDMLPQMIARVRQLGIERHFEFPGFLRGQEVEEMYSMADVYVMPSVSEPFGIAALEAISFDTPVILSRQSGVSEVLSHALKVDFWDTQRMADLMINALLHDELRADLVQMAREELKSVRWEASAAEMSQVYSQVTGV